MLFETENIEFKVQMVDNLYREVIAFANTDGGTIYIGIDDSGNVVGLDQVDDTYTRITNGIRDSILPDVTMFIKYTLQDNKVIRIAVSEGANKPYYLKAKGLKPAGVFLRQGASTVQASPDQIRQMIKETDGDVFECMRSMEQELTFEEASKAFQRYKIQFSKEKYVALGIQNISDSQFTNLGLILSDQCTYTTKAAVFGDDTNTVFKDNREFGGSVFRQLDEIFRYLMLCNRTISTFSGLERVEKQDYPEEAIREALLNALVHRDYSFSGSIIINVNDTSMEFISLGGLPTGLTAEDIRSGISQPRNRKLAEVFHRLHLIESYGTGIRRIYKLYEGCSVQPRIEVTPNTFKMILPNMNHLPVNESTERTAANLTPQMQSVIDFLKNEGEAREDQLQKLLGVKRTRAYTILRQMREQNLISVTGRGVNKRYFLG